MKKIHQKIPELDLTPAKMCKDYDNDCEIFEEINAPFYCWTAEVLNTAVEKNDGYCPLISKIFTDTSKIK